MLRFRFLSGLTRAALVVSVTFLATRANEAEAGCGDYVVIGKKKAEQRVLETQQHTEPTSPASPCHGPGCDQNRPTPSTPLPQIDQSRSSEQASLARLLAPFSDRGRWSTIAGRPQFPADGFPLNIDRPPQI